MTVQSDCDVIMCSLTASPMELCVQPFSLVLHLLHPELCNWNSDVILADFWTLVTWMELCIAIENFSVVIWNCSSD